MKLKELLEVTKIHDVQIVDSEGMFISEDTCYENIYQFLECTVKRVEVRNENMLYITIQKRMKGGHK